MSCRDATSIRTIGSRQATVALEAVTIRDRMASPIVWTAAGPPSLANRLNAVRSTTPTVKNVAASGPNLA